MADLLVPLIIAGILTCGARKKVDLYAVFAQGVKKGLNVLGSILPPMLLMTVGITMLQSTGAIDHLAELLEKPASMLGLPAPCIPLMVLRPFSGSGGLSLGISIMERYGVESMVGRTAAVMLGAAETSFYTIGIYAAHLKGKDLKKIILAALAGDLAAFLSSAFFVQLLMK